MGKAVLMFLIVASEGLDGGLCSTVDGWNAGAVDPIEGVCLLAGSRDG